MQKKHNNLIIAIDGPAASGKSTIAKKIALFFNLQYVNTGKLYRILAYNMIKQDQNINKEFLENFVLSATESYYNNNHDNLYSEEVGKIASILATKPEVRCALLNIQRELAYSQPNGAVLDGRDIGSVVCPNADFKFFITAKLSLRAQRRFKELKSLKKTMYKQTLFKLAERDVRDINRQASPLLHINDAIYIDTSHIGLKQVFDKIIKKILVIK